MKTFFKAVGIFFLSIAICAALAGLIWLIFKADRIAVAMISISPLVAISSVVGYVKDQMKQKTEG